MKKRKMDMYVSAASGSVVQYDWDGSIWDGAGYSGISGCFRAAQAVSIQAPSAVLNGSIHRKAVV